MAILIIAEHDNQSLKGATLNTVTAANCIGGELHVLVMGHHCQKAAEQAARVAGVAKVRVADAEHYEHALAENLAPLVVRVADEYTHLLAPATTAGKNLMPRVAAKGVKTPRRNESEGSSNYVTRCRDVNPSLGWGRQHRPAMCLHMVRGRACMIGPERW